MAAQRAISVKCISTYGIFDGKQERKWVGYCRRDFVQAARGVV